MGDTLRLSPLRLLPTELMTCVLETLDQRNLLSLRLTCRALCYHSTPLAFQELHVWLEEKSLQKLVTIATKPEFSRNVRTITLAMEQFYNVNFEEFRTCVYPDIEVRPKIIPDKSDIALREAWSVYRDYYQKQQVLFKSNYDVEMMTKALAAFSSLVTINIVDFQTGVDGCNEGPKLLGQETALRRHMLTVPDYQLFVPRGGRQMQILFGALALTETKVEEVSLRLSSFNITPDGFYSPVLQEVCRLAAPAFARLKKLSLVLLSAVPDKEYPREVTSLTNILQAATQLESLLIVLHDEPLKAVIQIPHVGQLKSLSIHGAFLHEADFVQFLLQSGQHLKKFYLAYGKVNEGSWDLIFETIRGIPHLEEVELFALWWEHSRGDMEVLKDIDPAPLYDYLLRRRSDSPWKSMCWEEWDAFPDSDVETEGWSEDEET